MKPTDPWMPVYVAELLAALQHLDSEAIGAYLLLLLNAWIRDGKLPNDDTQLRLMAKTDVQHWTRVRGLIEPFFQIRDGFWTQKRLTEELERARSVYEKRSSAGRKGASERWQSQCDANGDAIAGPKATPSPSQWQNDSLVHKQVQCTKNPPLSPPLCKTGNSLTCTEDQAREWFRSVDPQPEPPYSQDEIHRAVLFFSANGWKLGVNPVREPFSAISTRIEDERLRQPKRPSKSKFSVPNI
jgi:uncharacterized protein YdaU (DUF1376 family)